MIRLGRAERRLLQTIDRRRVVLGVDRKGRRAYIADHGFRKSRVLNRRRMARAQDSGFVTAIVHETPSGDRLTAYYLTHRGVRALIGG